MKNQELPEAWIGGLVKVVKGAYQGGKAAATAAKVSKTVKNVSKTASKSKSPKAGISTKPKSTTKSTTPKAESTTKPKKTTEPKKTTTKKPTTAKPKVTGEERKKMVEDLGKKGILTKAKEKWYGGKPLGPDNTYTSMQKTNAAIKRGKKVAKTIGIGTALYAAGSAAYDKYKKGKKIEQVKSKWKKRGYNFD